MPVMTEDDSICTVCEDIQNMAEWVGTSRDARLIAVSIGLLAGLVYDALSGINRQLEEIDKSITRCQS